MSKFFMAMEQAELERALSERAHREEANQAKVVRCAPRAPREDPPPARMPVGAVPSSAAPVVYRVHEVKAQDGMLVAVATAGDGDISGKVDVVIPIPPALHWIQPLLLALPLQLLAYHLAVLRGCDEDRRRNLAKSAMAE